MNIVPYVKRIVNVVVSMEFHKTSALRKLSQWNCIINSNDVGIWKSNIFIVVLDKLNKFNLKIYLYYKRKMVTNKLRLVHLGIIAYQNVHLQDDFCQQRGLSC